MNELIKISIGEIGAQTMQTANARELHSFLESGEHFATWIQERIAQYDFVEGQDYVTYSESAEKGRPRKEYAIALDMAKELAMVERNSKGKQARQYFIECERQAKTIGYTAPKSNRPLSRNQVAANVTLGSGSGLCMRVPRSFEDGTMRSRSSPTRVTF
mgnify:CR=1 FL=1